MVAEDFTLDAMLEIDDSQVDDVNNELEASVTGGGDGDISPAQQDQQESIVAGGVSKGLLAAGVLGGLLSQLKSITGVINAVFGIISRALVPAVEILADLFRPVVGFVNDFLADPLGTIAKSGRSNVPVTNVPTENGQLPPGGSETESGQRVITPSSQGRLLQDQIVEAIVGFFTDPSKTADQTGEQSKQQAKNAVEDARRDKAGGG